MITFEWLPVLLLFPLPWVIRWAMPKANAAEQGLLRVPFFQDVSELAEQQHHAQATHSLPYKLWLLLIWLLLLTAAARPLYIGDAITLPAEGRDLMLAVDVSGSMEQEDLELRGQPVDRLTATKDVLNDFIGRRTGDRQGLILFGSQAYLQTPLTFDHKTLQQLLNEAQIGVAGQKTAIGDAIGLALKRLKDRPTESKVLVLLTDGQQTAGAIMPDKAAELAAQKGLKIYTIGLGADRMQVPGFFGPRTVNPSADLNEPMLKQIAAVTGGMYFRAKDTDSLREIYKELDQLEPVESDSTTFRPVKSLFYIPLGAALALSFLLAIYHLVRDLLPQRTAQTDTAKLVLDPTTGMKDDNKQSNHQNTDRSVG